MPNVIKRLAPASVSRPAAKPAAKMPVAPGPFTIKPANPSQKLQPANPKPGTAGGGTVSLATELSEPVKYIEEVTWLIYGDGGIGKTFLASQFPKAHFLFFEPGGKGLRLHARTVASWKEFVAYIDLLQADNQFHTVVLDVADKMYEKCMAHVCKLEGMTHPNDKPYGEGWNLIRKEFEGQLERLAATGKGLVFIAHADDKEFQTRSGMKYQKIVPAMPKQAREFIHGFVDVTAFYGYYGSDRYLTIRASDELDAKNRLGFNFQTTDGKPVHSIPMFDNDKPYFKESDAYTNLVKAFTNKQVGTGEPEESVTLSNMPVKRETKNRR